MSPLVSRQALYSANLTSSSKLIPELHPVSNNTELITIIKALRIYEAYAPFFVSVKTPPTTRVFSPPEIRWGQLIIGEITAPRLSWPKSNYFPRVLPLIGLDRSYLR